MGPLQRVAGLDFTGSAGGSQAVHYALGYLGVAAILVAAAFFRRARQLRGA